MKNRLEFDSELRSFLGVPNVYFQPPENIKLKYPCIIYHLRNINSLYADNIAYKNMKGYEVTIICKDPDNNLVEEFLEQFEYASFDRFFVNDNLNHYTFVVFF